MKMIDEKKLIEKQIMELNTISKIYENKPLGSFLSAVANTMFGLFSKLQFEKYCDEWIPCSERLPDNDKNVIACIKPYDISLLYLGLDDAWRFAHNDEFVKDIVLAWQPLPEPYCKKEDSTESDSEKQKLKQGRNG